MQFCNTCCFLSISVTLLKITISCIIKTGECGYRTPTHLSPLCLPMRCASEPLPAEGKAAGSVRVTEAECSLKSLEATETMTRVWLTEPEGTGRTRCTHTRKWRKGEGKDISFQV